MLRIVSSGDSEALSALLAGRSSRLDEAERTVLPIIESVREQGDQALLDHARRLDGFSGTTLRVPAEDLRSARRELPRPLVQAVRVAAERVRSFAERQMPSAWRRSESDGVELGQLVLPLDSVGAYVPGGRYPLPSTLIMTVVPAQAAGVDRIVVTCPRPSKVVLGTASLLGVDEIYSVGGAHAIAALAFGTASVPRVDRIVGPGNAYVAAAKRLLAGRTGIDFVAGPTEIVLVFEAGDAGSIAADMLAQAEHDVDAAAVLITPSRQLARRVAAEVELQLPSLPTRSVAEQAIRDNSAAVVTDSLEEACDLSNRFAPEHVAVSEAVPLERIRHAGSVFVGPWSAEAAGDYAVGPNHVLPTGGASRLRGGLSVLDYVRVVSVQRLSEGGLKRLAPVVTTMARAEGLEAHARSIEMRFRQTGSAHSA